MNKFHSKNWDTTFNISIDVMHYLCFKPKCSPWLSSKWTNNNVSCLGYIPTPCPPVRYKTGQMVSYIYHRIMKIHRMTSRPSPFKHHEHFFLSKFRYKLCLILAIFFYLVWDQTAKTVPRFTQNCAYWEGPDNVNFKQNVNITILLVPKEISDRRWS